MTHDPWQREALDLLEEAHAADFTVLDLLEDNAPAELCTQVTGEIRGWLEEWVAEWDVS